MGGSTGEEDEKIDENVKRIQRKNSWIKYAQFVSLKYDINFLDVLKLNVFTAKFMVDNEKYRNELK